MLWYSGCTSECTKKYRFVATKKQLAKNTLYKRPSRTRCSKYSVDTILQYDISLIARSEITLQRKQTRKPSQGFQRGLSVRPASAATLYLVPANECPIYNLHHQKVGTPFDLAFSSVKRFYDRNLHYIILYNSSIIVDSCLVRMYIQILRILLLIQNNQSTDAGWRQRQVSCFASFLRQLTTFCTFSFTVFTAVVWAVGYH